AGAGRGDSALGEDRVRRHGHLRSVHEPARRGRRYGRHADLEPGLSLDQERRRGVLGGRHAGGSAVTRVCVLRVVAATALVTATTAHADPLDEIGFGAAATAMANARTAMATGADAVHTNPAGVARIARPEVLAGWQYAHQRLEL